MSESHRTRLTPRGRLLACIGGASLVMFALHNNMPSDDGPKTCYETTVGEYGATTPINAIEETLQREAGVRDFTVLEGINNTANAAALRLHQQHVKYDYVMPGDSFGTCMQGNSVTLEPHSVRANDV